MWSPNELLKIEKQRDILSYITLQFFHFKKVPLEHCPFLCGAFLSGGDYRDRTGDLLHAMQALSQLS